MKRIFLALALTVASAALASATTVLCNSGITDVTTLTGSNFCDLTGATNVLFGNFSVSYTGGALPPVGISTLAGQTNVSGGNINLGFQFEAPTNGTGDIQLEYTVTGGTSMELTITSWLLPPPTVVLSPSRSMRARLRLARPARSRINSRT